MLVNLVTPDLNLNSGMISKQILQKAGIELSTELKQNYPNGITPDTIAISKAGRLNNFERIFHITNPKYVDSRSCTKVYQVLFNA